MRRFSASSLLLFAYLLLTPAGLAETSVVLPFANLAKDQALDWVGESICENIADALSAEGLLVLDRENRCEVYRRMSLRQYALLTRATVIKVGEALDADHVIFGQFSVSGEPSGKRSIRLAARVLDLTRLRQSIEFSQTAPLEDLASLQVNLAWEAYRYLRPQSARSEAEFKTSRQVPRIDAMEITSAAWLRRPRSSGTGSLRRRRDWTRTTRSRAFSWAGGTGSARTIWSRPTGSNRSPHPTRTTARRRSCSAFRVTSWVTTLARKRPLPASRNRFH